MKKILIVMMAAIVTGCASGPTAREVADGAALGGAPILSIGARIVDLFSRMGKPKVDRLSPELVIYMQQTPMAMIKANGSVTWRPRTVRNADGTTRTVTEKNADPVAMDKYSFALISRDRFLKGDFGDTEEIRSNKINEYGAGKGVDIEYKNTKGDFGVVVRVDAEGYTVMMSIEEFRAVKSGKKLWPDKPS